MRGRHFRRRLTCAVLAIISIILLVVSAPGLSSTSLVPSELPRSASSPATPFKYLVTIVEENQPAYADIGIVGNSQDAPYINNVLIPMGGLALNYHSTSHNGSLAQYIGMISGNSRCFDNPPDPQGGNACLISGDTIVDRIESSGRTWKAFMEDYKDCSTNSDQTGCNANGCFMNLWWAGTGQYLANHNPFLYFPGITNSKARCSDIVPANSVPAGYTKFEAYPDLFLKHLNSTNPSNYIFMVPNHCDSFHGPFSIWQCDPYVCPSMGVNAAACLHAQVQAGDTYLKQVVPKILSSKLFQTGEAALFIAFDEPNSHPTRDPICSNPNSATPSFAEACPIFGLWVGGDKSAVKSGFQSNTLYTHYSYLRTIESSWQLTPLTTNDTNASPMGEFFTVPFPPPTASFSFTPAYPFANDKVSFKVTTVTGASSSYDYSWTFGDGATAIGSSAEHSFSTANTYMVQLKVTDDQGQSGTSNQNIEVTISLKSSFTYSPQTLSVGATTSFSSQADGGKTPYSYKWDFGDGGRANVTNPTHVYPNPGTYHVSLSVTDSLQHMSNSQAELSVNAMAGSFGSDPSDAIVGDTIRFTGSVDGGTPPYLYAWSFGDGGTASQQSVTHAYSSVATFTVVLNITDSASRSAIVKRQVTIDKVALGANISLTPENPVAGQPLRFTSLTNGGNAPYVYTWNFGDGTSGSGETIVHSYNSVGTYHVLLVVQDLKNHTYRTSATIDVNQLVPSNTSGLLSGSLPFLILALISGAVLSIGIYSLRSRFFGRAKG